MFSYFTNPEYWLSLLYSLPAVLIALSFHEYAHAWTAYRCGDPTAKNLGRMSLDPVKQMDLVGTICLLFFRFGWAKPVPVNPRNFRHPRRDEILVSLSGIIMNFILSFAAYGILFVTMTWLGWTNPIYVNIMLPVVTLNITLGLFNLLPIPPLDGFQFFAAVFPRPMAKFGGAVGRYGMVLLLILMITGIIGWLLNGFTNWLIGAYNGFWSLFA